MAERPAAPAPQDRAARQAGMQQQADARRAQMQERMDAAIDNLPAAPLGSEAPAAAPAPVAPAPAYGYGQPGGYYGVPPYGYYGAGPYGYGYPWRR